MNYSIEILETLHRIVANYVHCHDVMAWLLAVNKNHEPLKSAESLTQ